MMKAIAFLVVLMLLVQPAEAESIRELIENSKTFDGKTVTVRGEVIGILKKENTAWINLLENGWAIGVFLRREQAENISVIGDYRHIGDIVEITGIFHMSCQAHGGDLDIHAENLAIISTGQEIRRLPNPLTVLLSSILLAALIYLAYYMKKLRKEKPLPLPFRP
jgi:hypothetical protein